MVQSFAELKNRTFTQLARTKFFDLSKPIVLPDLNTEYVNGRRFYVTPNNNKYPSVTTVLSTMNKDAIEEWRLRVGIEEAQKITTQASGRGTSVHSIAEKYLLNEKDYARDAMPANLASFKHIQKYLDKWCDEVYANEIALYSDELRTAGRCDLIARIHGIRTVCDFKTAKKAKPREWILNYFYQCTTYAIMLYERTGLWCPQICILIATDEDGLQFFIDHTVNYVKPVKEFFNNYHDTR